VPSDECSLSEILLAGKIEEDDVCAVIYQALAVREKGSGHYGVPDELEAVGEFCKEAVKEGSFKGSYRMNVKEQMEVRMGKIWNEGSKVRAVVVGGSQMGRLGAEVGQKGKEAVEVEGWVKVKGRLDREEMERVVEQAV
jgi:hypothetical protein